MTGYLIKVCCCALNLSLSEHRLRNKFSVASVWVFCQKSYPCLSSSSFCYFISFRGLDRGLSNTPKLSPIDEIHQQPDSTEVTAVRERLCKYTLKWCCGVDWKCRQMDSIGSDGDGLPRQESIGLTGSQFARDSVNIRLNCSAVKSTLDRDLCSLSSSCPIVWVDL